MAPWLLALAFFILACQEPPDEPHRENLLVLLGSSTAAGIGASEPDSSWAGLYQAYLATMDPPWKLRNLAISGYTTFHILPMKLKPSAGRPKPDSLNNITQALRLRPRAIIINLPSNDVNAGFPLAEQVSNFEILESEAASASVPIWVCTPQPRTSLDSVQRKVLMELGTWIQARFHPRVIDFWTGLAEADGAILLQFDAGDGVHLNNLGHRLLADRSIQARITQPAHANVLRNNHATRYPQADLADMEIGLTLSLRPRLAW